jgi:hypothetical protein
MEKTRRKKGMGEPRDDSRLPEIMNRRSPDQLFPDNITAPIREMQTKISAGPRPSHWAGKRWHAISCEHRKNNHRQLQRTEKRKTLSPEEGAT